MRRTIQRRVENELSRMVLGSSVQPGDRVVVDASGDQLSFDVQKVEEPAATPA